MSERLKILKREPGNAQVTEGIRNDPVESALFGEYANSLSNPTERTELQEIIKKRLARTGLSPDEQGKWQNHTYQFLERKKAAERLLGNLNDEDTKELGAILPQHFAGVEPDEFPFYIQGIAVRDDAAFKPLAEAVRAWKHTERDRVSERNAKQWKEQLDRLAGRYGVNQKEIERLVNTSDDDERMKELQAAVGKRHWILAGVDILRQPYFGTRAGALNDTINELRRESAGLEQDLNRIVTVLCSIDTGKDRWWKDLPEIFHKKHALETLPEAQKPLTINEAQRAISTESVKGTWEKSLVEMGGTVKSEWERLKKVHAATPANIWSESVDTGGGKMQTFDEMWGGVSKGIEAGIAKRGWLSKFLELLFNPLVVSGLTKAKDQLPTA